MGLRRSGSKSPKHITKVYDWVALLRRADCIYRSDGVVACVLVSILSGTWSNEEALLGEGGTMRYCQIVVYSLSKTIFRSTTSFMSTTVYFHSVLKLKKNEWIIQWSKIILTCVLGRFRSNCSNFWWSNRNTMKIITCNL